MIMATPEEQIKAEIARKTVVSRALLNDIGEVLKRSITKNFQVGGRHNGAPQSFTGGGQRWQDLAPATKRERTRKGRFGNAAKGDADFTILVRQGILRNSIAHRPIGDNTLVIGSNVKYAAIHHFGGYAGRGKKVRIPARPWLVVQPSDVEVIRKLVLAEFT
jgi:phage virion morphogenesis protein